MRGRLSDPWCWPFAVYCLLYGWLEWDPMWIWMRSHTTFVRWCRAPDNSGGGQKIAIRYQSFGIACGVHWDVDYEIIKCQRGHSNQYFTTLPKMLGTISTYTAFPRDRVGCRACPAAVDVGGALCEVCTVCGALCEVCTVCECLW